MGQKTRRRPEAPSDGRGSCRWVVRNLRAPRRDRRRSCCGATRPAVSSAQSVPSPEQYYVTLITQPLR